MSIMITKVKFFDYIFTAVFDVAHSLTLFVDDNHQNTNKTSILPSFSNVRR